jgi:hypothetical protein
VFQTKNKNMWRSTQNIYTLKIRNTNKRNIYWRATRHANIQKHQNWRFSQRAESSNTWRNSKMCFRNSKLLWRRMFGSSKRQPQNFIISAPPGTSKSERTKKHTSRNQPCTNTLHPVHVADTKVLEYEKTQTLKNRHPSSKIRPSRPASAVFYCIRWHPRVGDFFAWSSLTSHFLMFEHTNATQTMNPQIGI